MDFDRRSVLRSAIWLPFAVSAGTLAASSRGTDSGSSSFKRIATEEAFSTPEVLGAQLELLVNHPETEPGFTHFREAALGESGGTLGQLTSVVGGRRTADFVNLIGKVASAIGNDGPVTLYGQLADLGDVRIRVMDETGVSMQVISLASPGVQVFDAEQGTALAKSSNDHLAQAVRGNPTRFAGLAAIAPQDPAGAAEELERAVGELGLKGAVINSHTKGEYLDEDKFRPILAKAEELGVPLYLHPRTPSPEMIKPFMKYPGLEGPTFGFHVETGLHAVRLILGGIFDDYPGLTVVLGHLGEGLPFWIDRIDNRAQSIQSDSGSEGSRRLRRRPSDYLRENFYLTTSGMDFEPALMLAHKVVGPDRLMFAVDYPYEDARNMVRVLDEAPMSDEDKEKIYQRNAERVFDL